MRSKRRLWIVLLALISLSAALFAVWHLTRERGKVETVEYDSKTIGGTRRMVVYLPPGYPRDAPYPVLYLLPGAGDDETVWIKRGSVHHILDGLHAEKKIVPMIVVMPNCVVLAGKGVTFEDDLLRDVIPFVDSRYATRADCENRAIAGLSLGGGRALDIGLKHMDTFAWVGGFSSSLAGKQPRDLLADPEAMRTKLKLLWISCGEEDHLRGLNRVLHDELEENKIPHEWHIGKGGHDWKVWRDDLNRFAQSLFRE